MGLVKEFNFLSCLHHICMFNVHIEDRRKYSGVYEYCILWNFLLRPFLTLCLRGNSQNTVHVLLIFFLILGIDITIYIFIQWSNILEQIVQKLTSLPPSKLVLLVNKQSLFWSGRLEITKSVQNDLQSWIQNLGLLTL